MMQLKPVKQKFQPSYPTLGAFVQNPNHINGFLPQRWLKNKYITAMLATSVICSQPESKANENNASLIENINSNIQDEQAEVASDITDSVRIAPLFIHGEGSGAIGCVVFSPPVFLSEDEALKIIINTFREEGIEFDSMDYPVFKIPVFREENEKTDTNNTMIELKMDAYNTHYNFTFKYLSTLTDDEIHQDEYFSSVSSYNFKETAEYLRSELKVRCKKNAVIFYDPTAEMSRNALKFWQDWDDIYESAIEDCKDDLVSQVEDFIEWMKKEGILEK